MVKIRGLRILAVPMMFECFLTPSGSNSEALDDRWGDILMSLGLYLAALGPLLAPLVPLLVALDTSGRSWTAA